MKLKNFIKKTNPKIEKDSKTFRTNLKSGKKLNRASQKAQVKSKKRIIILILLSLCIFTAVLALFIAGFIYRNYILDQIRTDSIISPGSQNVIEVNKARDILIEKDIAINELNYSSESASLTLQIIDGPIVYFSNSQDFMKQAEMLSEILYSLKNEDRSAVIIDLRYNKPIVKF